MYKKNSELNELNILRKEKILFECEKRLSGQILPHNYLMCTVREGGKNGRNRFRQSAKLFLFSV